MSRLTKEQRLNRADDRIRKLIEPIPGIAYGYIGNLDVTRGRDDRRWGFFLENDDGPFYGCATEDRIKLVGEAQNIRLGFDLANGGEA